MKIRSKLFLFAFALLLSNQSFAQGLSKGIEVAVTTSTIKISDIDDNVINSIKGDNILGYEAGLFLKFSVAVLYVKPKVLFHYEEGDLNYTINTTEYSTKFSGGKLLVPVLIGYKFLPPVLNIEAGPVFNYLVFATKNFEGNKVDVEKAGLGYRVGLSADLSILNVGISYQGVKNNSSASDVASYQAPNTLVFGLGIKF
jgi:hypothetical protein